MQATCSLSADVFAGAETTLKERRSPEQKVGKRESLCDPELARRDDDEHACRTARTRGRSGLYAATRRRGDDAARVRGCRPRCRSSSLHQLA